MVPVHPSGSYRNSDRHVPCRPSNHALNPGADPVTGISPLRVRPSIALALCCAGLLTPTLSSATEWSAKPSMSLTVQHDDNLLLTTAPHHSVTGLTLAPRVDLSAQQANWDVTGSAELRGHRYWGQSGLSGNDQIYNLSSLYRTQRSTWQLGGGYSKESVTASTTFSPDIGLVSTETQRIMRTANPSWTWQMTQRTQLQLNYQSSLVSYQNVIHTNLVNYSSRDGTATLLYQWSPQDQLTAQIDRSYFKVPQIGSSQLGQPAYSIQTTNGLLTLQPNPKALSNTSITDSLVLGWSHSFSQTLSANLAVGARQTNSDMVVQTCSGSTQPTVYFINGQLIGIGTCIQTASTGYPEKSSGYLFKAGLNKQFELTNVNLTLGQQITPSGIGAQVVMDSAILSVSRKISARLNANLSASGYRIRTIGNTGSNLADENYALASADLNWQWTRQLTVDAGYRYITLKFLDSGIRAHGDNTVYLKLDYAWHRFAVSR